MISKAGFNGLKEVRSVLGCRSLSSLYAYIKILKLIYLNINKYTLLFITNIKVGPGYAFSIVN